MGKHFYMRSDGNGGINVSKIVAVIGLLLTLVPPIFAYGILTGRVDNVEKQTLKNSMIEEQMVNKLNQQETNNAVLNNRLDNIDDKLDEIKSDVKELKKVN